nr:ankyrin repeat domain-containing protein [Lysinibacillus fusiformis]
MLALESFNQLTEADKTQLKKDFFQAAAQGEVTQVTEILNKGIDINVADEQGRTAAMIATYGNFPDVVKVLIEHGADINRRDHMENNPFLYAGAEGYLEILKLTIEAGANPTIFNRFGGTALIPAAEHGYVENVRELLEHTNVDVNHMNKPGWTALLEAIIYGNGRPRYHETILLLIEHGADVHLADAKGIPPLQHAQSREFQAISNILIQAGAK